MKILITGGAGFIGSHLVRRLLSRGDEIWMIDALTYAGDMRRLEGISGSYVFERVDVRDSRFLDAVREARPDVLVHLAAQTHVTRSETASDEFHSVNVEGTAAVLAAARAAGGSLVVHISTDEVYGPCSRDPFAEEDKLPGPGYATSPYAISKALADDLAIAASSEQPVIVLRPSNCYGPFQHPEKAVVRWITRALRGHPLPVWGDGGQVRDWMFVDDLCSGILTVIDHGRRGEVYNVGPQGEEVSNLEVAKSIARIAGFPEGAVYLTDYDRPQHDRRYAINSAKLRGLGWEPSTPLKAGLSRTFDWYRAHRAWWEPLVSTAEDLYDDKSERTTL